MTRGAGERLGAVGAAGVGLAVVLAVVLAVTLLLAGCGPPRDGSASAGGPVTTAPVARAVPSPPASSGGPTGPPPNRGAGRLGLAVEPDAGMGPVYDLIASARRTLDMTMYELADPTAEGLLVAAHRRGVAVRVLLDRAYSGGRVDRAAYGALARAGVPVRWAPNGVVFHQKTVTADGTRSALMTGNLTSRDYATTRDYVVTDSRPADVAAIEAVFASDWSGDLPAPGPPGAGLVWSPGAAGRLVELITSATRTVVVENEEMADRRVEDALEAAAGRGVDVTVVMTADPEWSTAFHRLRSAGVRVVTYPDRAAALYIHAKAIDVDGSTAFVGSENFSPSSLDRNRELGILTADPAVLRPLGAALAADASGTGAP